MATRAPDWGGILLSATSLCLFCHLIFKTYCEIAIDSFFPWYGFFLRGFAIFLCHLATLLSPSPNPIQKKYVCVYKSELFSPCCESTPM